MCAISWKKERLNELIDYIADLMNKEVNRKYPEVKPLFTSKSTTAFLRNGYNWECEFIRETDCEDLKIDHQDTVWKRITYSSKKPSIDSKLYKPFERSTLSNDALRQCRRNFKKTMFNSAKIFKDHVNDIDTNSDINEIFQPDFWKGFKKQLRQKYIPKPLGNPISLEDIVTSSLAIATRGTESTTPMPPKVADYQTHPGIQKGNSLEAEFTNQLTHSLHFGIGGRKHTGKTTFVIHSLQDCYFDHIFYTTYSAWKETYIFKLDQEVWASLNLDYTIKPDQIPSGLLMKEATNIRGLSAYLHGQGVLIIDDVPQKHLNELTSELADYSGKIVFIADSLLTEESCPIQYINIPELDYSNWIQILSEKLDCSLDTQKIIREIYDSVRGELTILNIISDTIDYLRKTNDKQVLPFLRKVRNDVCKKQNSDNKINPQDSLINQGISKYRVRPTIDKSETTFNGHIIAALNWINEELSASDKQLLYFLVLAKNAHLKLNELSVLYGIEQKDLSNLLATNWITIENNAVILKMCPYIIQKVISFDTADVSLNRFNAVCEYTKKYIQNCRNNLTGLFPGRIKNIFKLTYDNMVKELLNTQNQAKNTMTASEIKQLLSQYIMTGLYFSYNCGDVELAQNLLQYEYPLKSYTSYQSKNYNRVIAAFIKDIEWIKDPRRDWWPSFFSQLGTSSCTFTEQDKNLIGWMTIRDIERNLFLLISSNRFEPLLIQELLTISGPITSYYLHIFNYYTEARRISNNDIDAQKLLIDKMAKSCEIAIHSPDLFKDQIVKYQAFICIEMSELIDSSSYKYQLLKYAKKYLEKGIHSLDQALQNYFYSLNP